MEYVILAYKDPEGLEDAVRQALSDGWTLHGSLVIELDDEGQLCWAREMIRGPVTTQICAEEEHEALYDRMRTLFTMQEQLATGHA